MSNIDALYGTADLPTSKVEALYAAHGGSRDVGSREERVAPQGGIKGSNGIIGSQQQAAQYYGSAAGQAAMLASDQKIANDLHIPLSQLSPQVLSNYAEEEANRDLSLPWYAKLAQTVGLGVASAGLASGLSGALGGGLTGSIAGGAAGGALTGGYNGIASGNLAKGLGTGIALGVAGGGISYGANSLGASNYLQGAGLNSTAANAIVGGASKAATGALSGQLSGQGAGAEAAQGAISGATGAVAGSIFNSGNTVNPTLTQDASASPPPSYLAANNQMADDYTFDPTNSGLYGPDLTGSTNVSYDPTMSGAGNIDFTNPMAGITNGQNGYGTDPTNQQLNFGGSDPTGGAGGSLAAKLLGLLGGGGGGNSATNALISKLLGLGANTGAGILNSAAAKSAANQYANQTHYQPYSTQTGLGSTGFNGTNAFANLSGANQQVQNNLQRLTNSSAQNLQQGPQAIANQYYNQLQAQDRDANNKMFQSNLDSQFGNGILSSTAGQYQTQGALSAINQKSLADQVAANQFGQNYQTQQLNNLTAGLNGSNQMNAQLLQQLGLGGQFGTDASKANLAAYFPSAEANANSTFGQVLSQLGQQAFYNQGKP